MDRVLTAVLAVASLVMAVGLGVLGFTLPAMWTMSSDVGGIKATLTAMDKRFDGFDKRFDGLDGRLEKIERTITGVDTRLAARESDPTVLLTQAGLRPDAEFGAVSVNGKVYVLPKTVSAIRFLEKAGLARDAITPSAYGYMIGSLDQGGRFKGVQASTVTVPVPAGQQ